MTRDTITTATAGVALFILSAAAAIGGAAEPSLLPETDRPDLFTVPAPQQPLADAHAYIAKAHKVRPAARSRSSAVPSAQPIYSSRHFRDTPEYESADGPAQVAVGDFNGDGIPDLVVGDFGPSLAIHLGKGDGSFQPFIKLGVNDFDRFGDAPAHWAVAAGDVNGDGKDDIVVNGIETARTIVFLSNGDGSFRQSQAIRSVVTVGMKLADVNDDGKLDLIVAGYGLDGRDGHVLVFLGKGNGTFLPRKAFEVGVHPDQVAVGDLNNDGKADIVAVNSGDVGGTDDHSVSVLLGNGDGTFRRKNDYPVSLHPQCVTLADLNGDGHLDVIASNLFTATVSVLLGNGDGTLAPRTDWETGLAPIEVVAADVNGDGKIDLLTVNDGGNTSSVLLGNGDGTFPRHQEWGNGTRVFGIAVADFNRDGKPDVAISNTLAGTLSIQIGNGDGTFRGYRQFLAGNGVTSIAALDKDRDGKPDLAVTSECGGQGCSESGFVRILRNLGAGEFGLTAEAYETTGPVAKARSIIATDLNGDRIDDLVWVSGDLVVLVRSTSGAGSVQTVYPTPTRYAAQVIAGDFNHDGKIDLATANVGDSANALISVYIGNGDGTFQAPVNYPGPQYAGAASSIAAGDLNGDGNLDLVVTDYFDDEVSVYPGKGDGTFGAHLDSLVYPRLRGIAPAGVVVGDFNRDGKQDIIVGGYNTNGVYFLAGKGDGTFETPFGYVTGDGPVSLSTADLNKDGFPDVVISNGVDGTLGILYGNHNGTFSLVERHNSGGDGYQALLVDSNGDGWTDIAVPTKGSYISLFRNMRAR